MNKIIMYSGTDCGACTMSKGLLKEYIDSGFIEIEDNVDIIKLAGITHIPYFMQLVGNTVMEHTGFANQEILESKGFVFKDDFEDDEELIDKMADEKRLYGCDTCSDS